MEEQGKYERDCDPGAATKADVAASDLVGSEDVSLRGGLEGCGAGWPKTLDIYEVQGAREIKDIKVYGNGDTFALLCKASSAAEGWMKSTKVCNVDGGAIVQVSTQQRNPDGSYSVAEALSFVPGVHLDTGQEPRRLVSMTELAHFEEIRRRMMGEATQPEGE